MGSLGVGPGARQRLSAPRVGEVLAGQLRRQIVDGQLADGELLPRQDILVEKFNVSLVSLREALRILETEGLVSIRRGNQGGAVVHAPTKAAAAYMLGLVLQSELVRLNDLGSALRELEPTCAALAAGREDRATTVVPALKNINESMAAHLNDVSMVTEIGRQFHDQLIHGCGNSTVIAVVGALEALWTSHEQQWADQLAARSDYPSPEDRRAVLNTHVRLTEAIEAGDVDRTRLLASTHLYEAQTYVLSVEPDTRIYAITPNAFSPPHEARST